MNRKIIILCLVIVVAVIFLVFFSIIENIHSEQRIPEGSWELQKSRIAAALACEIACDYAKRSGQNLSSGPCLLNPIQQTRWVCDIAHNPRQQMDNLPENQCSAYREGRAGFFVEIDEECNLIRTSDIGSP
jgi:hypothetical protein